jgi:hypothetical protein
METNAPADRSASPRGLTAQLGRHQRVVALLQVLEAKLGHRLAQRLMQPLGDQRAMAPLAGVRPLEAAEDRDAPARQLGELGDDRARVMLWARRRGGLQPQRNLAPLPARV